PHAHILLLTKSPIDDQACQRLADSAFHRWLTCLKAQGGYDADRRHGVNVMSGDMAIAEYVAKIGRLPKGEVWGPIHELTKSISKVSRDEKGKSFLQLLWDYSKGDKQAGALAREYGLTMKGTHQLQWSPGLKERLGLKEVDDEEIASDGPVAGDLETLASLTYDNYLKVFKAEKIPVLLEITRVGDLGLLKTFLGGLGATIIDPPKPGDVVAHIDFTPWNTAQGDIEVTLSQAGTGLAQPDTTKGDIPPATRQVCFDIDLLDYRF
ncbi:MAG: hypothetical protein ACRD72_23980, partial [Candidatus Angelobacter sp.]